MIFICSAINIFIFAHLDAHCSSSRRIILHYKQCLDPVCKLCKPLKSRANIQQGMGQNLQTAPLQQDIAGLNSLQFPDQSSFTGPPKDNISNSARFLLSSASLPPANSTLTTSIAGDINQSQSASPQTQIPLSAAMVTQSWHQEVKQDLRQHLVKKLVMAIYPSANMQDPGVKNNRMNVLFTQAKRMEGMMFQQASSREEYYQMLAEKIYNIQKELDTRQKQRKLNSTYPIGDYTDPMLGLVSYNPNYAPQMQGPPYMGVRPSGPMPGYVNYHSIPPPGMPRTDQSMVPPQILGDLISQVPPSMNRPVNMHSEYMPMPHMQPGSWAPSPGRHDMGVGVYGNYPSLLPSSDIDMELSKMGQVPSHMGSPYGGMPGSVQSDFNTTYNMIPPNKTITAKEVPIMGNNYQQISVPQNQRPSINMPPSSQPTINPASVPAPSTPGAVGHSTQQVAASSTTMLPQPSDSSTHKEGGLLHEDIKAEISSDNPISSLHSDLEHSLDIQPSHLPIHLAQQNENSMDMDTENTVTTASASTTTLQDNSSILQEKLDTQPLDKVTSIKTELDFEDTPSSKRPDSMHSLMDGVIKQEPMSVDTVSSNKGKDLGYPHSESASTPITSHSNAPSLGPAPIRGSKPKRLYPRDQLYNLFNPILTTLWNCESDAEAFREPVDPITLGIPDYHSIITYPMDLSTINQRLANGDYQCPWQFIDDIWLMFNNAWLFNRRNTRVYKSCTKLSEVYEMEIAPVIQELGLCCGKKFDYSPQVLYCSSKNLCPINRDDHYWNYKERYYYCQKCYSELEGDVVRLADETGSSAKKEEFKKCKNDYLEAEPFIDCKVCLRRFHQVCVLYLSPLFPNGFTCKNCLSSQTDLPLELNHRNSARQLPQYGISKFIEERVHALLREKECNEDVFVRLVSTGERSIELKHKMKERYPDHATTFPYHTKALFAFEMVDDVEVCFYGMHVQEYGADCPEPNRNRVYISYLDSVFYFRPRQLRTDVYHEILISYLEYCKGQGYLYAHIWACPPSEGDDYIFHCHPVEQKTPKPRRLQEWYKAMLEKAIERSAVSSYTDIYSDFLEHESNPTAIPYFEGDFWPNVIENFIKEIDHEEQERKQEEGRGNKKGGRGNKNKKNPTARKTKGKFPAPNGGDELIQKISYLAEKYKETFFVIEIQAEFEPGPLKDIESVVQCDLMDGRDNFLTLARDRHLEFSSLRRAKYSTMALAYELHNQGHDKFFYTCNYCSTHVESRYHCNTCEDFDLCEACNKNNSHEHTLELWRGEGEDEGGSKEANQQQTPEQILQRRIQTLLHTLQCKNQDQCRTRNCALIKKLMRHASRHLQFKPNTCTYCYNFFSLILNHSKMCIDAKCNVPFCSRLKVKLSEQKRMKRRNDDIMYRRRMRNMDSPTAPPTPPRSIPPSSDPIPIDDPATSSTAMLNPSSVKSTKSPCPPPLSVNESPIEQCKMTTQGPPPAGVEAEQQAKLIVAEAMSGNTDPSLYNEASPVTLSGQQYRMSGSPMTISRPSPMMDQSMMYNSPVAQQWNGNMGRGSPMHHGLMPNKSPNSLPPQVRNILNQLNSPHQDQKHKAMQLAREDPDLLASIISIRSNPSRGVSPGFNPAPESRNPGYGMPPMQPYLNSGGGVPMQGGMNRTLRLPSQSIMPSQGMLPQGGHHQVNLMSSQMPMSMQRPQTLNRIHLAHTRMGSSVSPYGVMGGPRGMNMGSGPFMPRHATPLTRSTSMPGMVPNQTMQGPNSAMQLQMQMQDGFIPPGYPTGGIDDMLIHPSAPHNMLTEQDRYYTMPPGGGNNMLQ
ncbi:CREB-binding protein isoform X2 [Oopsacas minuta]|uniref:histone acetyltransferase n=1 Tax=Oopsacas minuta TaxID=111878 RepID=A0AAV7JGL1_9METZ|nr:CREB-binding protein isoform X2 [Oopsacas minuta]